MGQPICIEDFPDDWEIKLQSFEEKLRITFFYILVIVFLIYLCF